MLDNLCKCGHQAFRHFESAIPNVDLGHGPCVRTECSCDGFVTPVKLLTQDQRNELSALLLWIAHRDYHRANSILQRYARVLSEVKLDQFSYFKLDLMRATATMKAEIKAAAVEDRKRVIKQALKTAEADVRDAAIRYNEVDSKLLALRGEARRLGVDPDSE